MKSYLEKFKAWCSNLGWEQKCLGMAGLLALLPVLGLSLKSDSEPAGAKARAAAVDTFIPKGFVLVPIEIENFEAVDSILGAYGVVDLLKPGQNNSGLVAKNVRLLRAPHNPAHFAILVRESEVDRILRHGGTFAVVIKRPSKDGTEFVQERRKPKRTIVYERGS